MTFPVNANADPDPTTQIAWPARQRRSSRSPSRQALLGDHDAHDRASYCADRLTTWNLITLSISMAGAQIAWTVELGYGTPFLLSLGVSEQVTSLVWLAGPISGLIAQPLIGAISDSSHSKYRRRYWVSLSTIFLVVSTLALAYCQTIAAFFVDAYGGGAGDWDPSRSKQVKNVAIGIAVFSFYILDFALNALQASLRNLLLDVTPPEQLNAGNAWHSRMSQAGNIVGYGFGFFPLAKLPFLRWLGGDQFRKFCVVSMIILVITVWTTCWCHEEKASLPSSKRNKSKLHDILENIYNAVIKLPKPIRRVCLVQVFAFMGWFPFLFYSTTYVGQIMAYETKTDPDPDVATRAGEFAMLIYSLVAVGAGVLLPHLARRDTRLLPREGETADTARRRMRNDINNWKADAAARGKTFRLPPLPLTLRNIWTGALLLFTLITFSTFFISTVAQATAAISLVGICWAVACWVPFAIIMELLKELQAPSPGPTTRPTSSRANSAYVPNEGSGHPHPSDVYEEVAEEIGVPTPIAGGTVLGIHNLAIVMPQFIVALVSSAIFRVVDEADPAADPLQGGTYLGKNGVAWVLRFGGLCTLIGAVVCRMVPATLTEKQMEHQRAEFKALVEEEEP
ncbi:MFS general substrate transporter [Coniophora puteana RWD-64-598 SS2]|uniref:MFS general substrate transporter n=1 Tax=Coniophora puteana (strain RWD-64-598) TaxID=741705 RepID=A0A5M3MTT3_CONPW|nr:MFS general substrate transporter [Coniophora puteana RWD-64-598 SS2]EIW82085.1 MFS general substrate transporter [Coniophora puteana RWD-64-598 SS2]